MAWVLSICEDMQVIPRALSEKGMGRSGSGSMPHILLDKVAAAHSNVIHGVVSLKLLRELPCITAGVECRSSLFSRYCFLRLFLRLLGAACTTGALPSSPAFDRFFFRLTLVPVPCQLPVSGGAGVSASPHSHLQNQLIMGITPQWLVAAMADLWSCAQRPDQHGLLDSWRGGDGEDPPSYSKISSFLLSPPPPPPPPHPSLCPLGAAEVVR